MAPTKADADNGTMDAREQIWERLQKDRDRGMKLLPSCCMGMKFHPKTCYRPLRSVVKAFGGVGGGGGGVEEQLGGDLRRVLKFPID